MTLWELLLEGRVRQSATSQHRRELGEWWTCQWDCDCGWLRRMWLITVAFCCRVDVHGKENSGLVEKVIRTDIMSLTLFQSGCSSRWSCRVAWKGKLSVCEVTRESCGRKEWAIKVALFCYAKCQNKQLRCCHISALFKLSSSIDAFMQHVLYKSLCWQLLFLGYSTHQIRAGHDALEYTLHDIYVDE